MRHSIDRCFVLCVVGLLCLAVGCDRKKETGELPAIAFIPLPKQAPVPLDPSNVEKFVDWVATMPSSQIGDVKEQIALAKGDPKIVDAVAGKLSYRNPGSYDRQLIYMSVLGEMKSERALGPLQNYLNSDECPVLEERAAVHAASNAPATSFFDACAGLKSQAINMIAYINSAAAKAIALKAVGGHASRTVRLSAMNAYLFNNGDSQEAISTVRQYARPQEIKFVGMPRLSPDTKDFAARLTRFYAEHPEELPPRPQPVSLKKTGSGKPGRISLTPSAAPARGDAK